MTDFSCISLLRPIISFILFVWYRIECLMQLFNCNIYFWYFDIVILLNNVIVISFLPHISQQISILRQDVSMQFITYGNYLLHVFVWYTIEFSMQLLNGKICFWYIDVVSLLNNFIIMSLVPYTFLTMRLIATFFSLVVCCCAFPPSHQTLFSYELFACICWLHGRFFSMQFIMHGIGMICFWYFDVVSLFTNFIIEKIVILFSFCHISVNKSSYFGKITSNFLNFMPLSLRGEMDFVTFTFLQPLYSGVSWLAAIFWVPQLVCLEHGFLFEIKIWCVLIHWR